MDIREMFNVEMVWRKGLVVVGYDENIYRKDDYGTWIRKGDYGNRQSDYGWEMDHMVPDSQNGSDDISNLRPLHWRNNASRQDGRF